MAKPPPILDLPALARRRLERTEPSPEDWAKAVEEARSRGYKLIRVNRELTVEIRNYSLMSEDD
jgi:DNA-binding IclR family transcriptional regulator